MRLILLLSALIATNTRAEVRTVDVSFHGGKTVEGTLEVRNGKITLAYRDGDKVISRNLLFSDKTQKLLVETLAAPPGQEWAIPNNNGVGSSFARAKLSEIKVGYVTNYAAPIRLIYETEGLKEELRDGKLTLSQEPKELFLDLTTAHTAMPMIANEEGKTYPRRWSEFEKSQKDLQAKGELPDLHYLRIAPKSITDKFEGRFMVRKLGETTDGRWLVAEEHALQDYYAGNLNEVAVYRVFPRSLESFLDKKKQTEYLKNSKPLPLKASPVLQVKDEYDQVVGTKLIHADVDRAYAEALRSIRVGLLSPPGDKPSKDSLQQEVTRLEKHLGGPAGDVPFVSPQEKRLCRGLSKFSSPN